MSQNTRLLLIALCVLVVFGIFLQSLIARSLQESFGEQTQTPHLPPAHPEQMKGLDGMPLPPGNAPGAAGAGKAKSGK